MDEARGSDRLGVYVGWLVMLAVVVHATQASVGVPLGAGKRLLNLSVVDVVLACAFGLWVARREFCLPRIYPAAVVGALWLALSLVPQLKGSAEVADVSLRLGLVNVVQFVAYFLVGHVLFVETFRDAQCRRRALRLLGWVTAVAVGAAVVQYCLEGVGVTEVRGSWFDNRNTFGAFLAIVLPLLFGCVLFGRSRVALAGVAALVVAGLCVCLSGGAFVAICAGVLVAAALRGRVAFAVTAVMLMLLGGLVLPHLPRRNTAVLLDSVALYKESDRDRVFNDDVAALAARLSARQAGLAAKVADGKSVDYGDLLREEDYSWKWQQRYKEWQAALNMMVECPLFGVGAGGYQRNVNRFYRSEGFGAMPKYAKNLLEPDTLNGYLVLGAGAGVPFLILLGAMFLRAGRFAVLRLGDEADADARGLAAGVVAALAALAVVAVFTNPFVRGVGVTLALVLALAEVLQSFSAKDAKL